MCSDELHESEAIVICHQLHYICSILNLHAQPELLGQTSPTTLESMTLALPQANTQLYAMSTNCIIIHIVGIVDLGGA